MRTSILECKLNLFNNWGRIGFRIELELLLFSNLYLQIINFLNFRNNHFHLLNKNLGKHYLLRDFYLAIHI